MRSEIRHAPSFATVRLHLDPGESVRAESGAMSAHSYGVTVSSSMQGGLGKALSRSLLGGESFFVTTYTASPSVPGWVDVAANLPGDAFTLTLDGTRALMITRGSWLASAATVQTETKWGGMSNMAGGEGGFLVRASGVGEVVVACYGALERHDLPPGQGFTLDTGHLVAMEEGVQVNARRVSRGMMQSLKSGEGLVFDVVGPGSVWTQSRSPSALVRWLSSLIGTRA